MGEMREWWANVYGPPGMPTVSVVPHKTSAEAAKYGEGARSGCVRVRLKPEGAPKRYGSQGERYFWEHFPDTAREYPAAAANTIRVPPQPPRTPKIEESAT